MQIRTYFVLSLIMLVYSLEVIENPSSTKPMVDRIMNLLVFLDKVLHILDSLSRTVLIRVRGTLDSNQIESGIF